MNSSFVRSRLVFASVAAASAARSWASSKEVSCFSRRSPARTLVPGSKAICTTLPANSVSTVTPWTAWSDPTAGKRDSQVCLRATAVVTVSGGGVCSAWALIRPIWRNLIPPRPATSAITPTMLRTISFFIVVHFPGVPSNGLTDNPVKGSPEAVKTTPFYRPDYYWLNLSSAGDISIRGKFDAVPASTQRDA